MTCVRSPAVGSWMRAGVRRTAPIAPPTRKYLVAGHQASHEGAREAGDD